MAVNSHFIQGYIREFQKGDLYEVMEIARQSFSEYYSSNLIIDLYNAWPKAFMVYILNDSVQGFIIGSRNHEGEARILLLAVKNELRGMGIGRSLMEHFVNFAIQNHMISIRLEVKIDNENAITFYRNFGFVITSRIKGYYSDASDAFTMWKII
ncbi:MAG: ribosomal protein S18-alanine N-acetyltransferase [Candidatus Thermoplasmatota archaeon]|nr:ribosomal protein S18-alanine N-acetyltransferase [Candidatus Thermoplasmatota archaeon]